MSFCKFFSVHDSTFISRFEQRPNIVVFVPVSGKQREVHVACKPRLPPAKDSDSANHAEAPVPAIEKILEVQGSLQQRIHSFGSGLAGFRLPVLILVNHRCCSTSPEVAAAGAARTAS